ncbi:hypothetical protein B566_EDAN016232, partial [Ephemera danica]
MVMNSQYAQQQQQQQHYGHPNSVGYPAATPSMQPQPGGFNPAHQLRPNALIKPGMAAQASPMLLPNMRQPGQEYNAYNGGMCLGSGAPTSQMAGLNLGQQQQMLVGPAGESPMSHMKPVPGSPMPPQHNIGPAAAIKPSPNMPPQHSLAPAGDNRMPPMKPVGMPGTGDAPMKAPGMMANPISQHQPNPMLQQHHIGPAGDGPMQAMKPPGMMASHMSQSQQHTGMLAGGDASMMSPPKMPHLNGAQDNRQQYVNGSPTCQSPGMMLPPMGQQQQQQAMPGAHMLAGPPYMAHTQPGMPQMQPKPTYPPQQPGRMVEQQYPGQHMQQQQPAYQQQPQQSRRLDPEQMPSPIQVMLEDQKAKLGPFVTNQRGQVPPLVTTTFVTRDEGNANPRFIRASMYSVPATIDMMKQ